MDALQDRPDPAAHPVGARLPEKPHKQLAAALKKEKRQLASALFSAIGWSEPHDGPLTLAYSVPSHPKTRSIEDISR